MQTGSTGQVGASLLGLANTFILIFGWILFKPPRRFKGKHTPIKNEQINTPFF
jgi:LPXTG-motif cell wall-anchored protein